MQPLPPQKCCNREDGKDRKRERERERERGRGREGDAANTHRWAPCGHNRSGMSCTLHGCRRRHGFASQRRIHPHATRSLKVLLLSTHLTRRPRLIDRICSSVGCPSNLLKSSHQALLRNSPCVQPSVVARIPH